MSDDGDRFEVPRIGIVGAGTISRYHAAAVRTVFGDRGVPIAVTDSNRASLDAFLLDEPAATAEGSVASMLASEPAPRDIVIIATPPATHAALAVAALRSGRNVLVEKPLATTLDDARRVVDEADRQGLVVAGCSGRFSGLATTTEVRELVADGRIGRLYRMTQVARRQRLRSGIEYQPESAWFLDPDVAGGGILMDGGPYDIALLVETLAPVAVEVRHAWVACPITAADPPTLDRARIETHVGATMLFHRGDGPPVTVDYERAACTHGPEAFITRLEGTSGAIDWEWMVHGDDGPSVTVATDKEGEVTKITDAVRDSQSLGPHDRPLATLWKRLEGDDMAGPVNRELLFEFEVIQAIYAVARGASAPVISRAGAN